MAAAARLYNPFREEQIKARQQEEEAASANIGGALSSGGAGQQQQQQPNSSSSSFFNFATQPTASLALSTTTTTSSTTRGGNGGDKGHGGGVDPFRNIVQRLDDFDPFQIASSTTTTISPTSVVTTMTTTTNNNNTSNNYPIPEIKTVGSNVSNKSNKSTKSNRSGTNGTIVKVTPKLVVKLSTHEEVTSRMKMALDEFDMTSEVSVEGTVYAQVQCSDATKNAPFALLIPHPIDHQQNAFCVQPNEKYSVSIRSTNNSGRQGGGGGGTATTEERGGAAPNNNTSTNTNAPIVVTIPKNEIVAVPIAHYSIQREVKFMPVLVERKVTRNGARVRIAIQIRSRLDNLGDMKGITILVAVPEKVNGETVTIVRGDGGTWCPLKRIIKWHIPHLIKGQSELVTAEADLWSKPTTVIATPTTTPGATTSLGNSGGGGACGIREMGAADETPFPVMFRCSSVADPITTSLEWKVAQVSGNPAQISVPSVTHTFRLLHRLP